MPMIPSESSICHTNLGATKCYVSYLGMATACNNEDYAKIGTRPHLDTDVSQLVSLLCPRYNS